MKVHTDWENHIWSVKTPSKQIELPVYYTAKKNLDNAAPKIVNSLQNVNMEKPKIIEFNLDSNIDQNNSDDSDSSDIEEVEGYMLIMASDDEEANKEIPKTIKECNIVVSPSEAIAKINYKNDEERLGKLLSKLEDNKFLSDEQRSSVREILLNYSDVFGVCYKHMKQTNLLEFSVDTRDAKPIYQKPFSRFSHDELILLKTELQEMVENGILIPHSYAENFGNGGWSFPCRYVAKKDGSKRLVTQFMKLNDVTVRDAWPIPSLKDTIESIGGANWISQYDMLKGFNAVPVSKSSIPKLTINTPYGAYSYRTLPFGVRNGPMAYSRCMYLACESFINRENPSVVNFFDDCTQFNNTFEEHLKDFKALLHRFRETKLTLNANKCSLFQYSVDLLGFNVSKDGIKPLPEKISKIQNFPRPMNQTAIRAFINLAGFYRSHIPCFTEIVNPLLLLLKKDTPFCWSDDCENAFQNLKKIMIDTFTLIFPDFDKEFYLFCDASDIAVGSVLSQKDKDGKFLPISFISRKLQAAEVNYPTVEKELLAVVYSVAKFRKYLLDKPFFLFTDNNAVVYIMSKQDSVSQRLQRWSMALSEFQFCVKHIKGKQNVVADVMSRYPTNGIVEEDLSVPDNIYDQLLFIDDCKYEPELQQVYNCLTIGNSGTFGDDIRNKSLKFKIFMGHLYKKVYPDRTVKIPYIDERVGVLQEIHDGAGHFGQNASWKRLYEKYWWPGCYEDIKSHVRQCNQCLLFSSKLPKLPYSSFPVTKLFECFAIDFVGPFPPSTHGNQYLLVAIEMYTRWPIAKAVEKADSDTVAYFLYENIFCMFGPFMSLLSDNGTHFDPQVIENFLAIMKVNIVLLLLIILNAME